MKRKKIEKFPLDVEHPYVAKRSQAQKEAQAREKAKARIEVHKLLGPTVVPFKGKRAVPFDPKGAGYDYEAARKAGMKRDKSGHMFSRSPSGQILKGMYHPTFHRTIIGEKKAGYEMYEGDDGKFYSRKAIK
jgi:hypothetical protein